MRAYLMAAVGLALASGPALADVKAGVDAWARGDFKAAVDEWRGPAVAGDADAQFNLGQAYKLGRGVPTDPALAQSWFRKAAAQGHTQAEDNLGLALFQDGRRDEALPWLEKSVGRDEKRAELVLGTMLFNGDGAPKDWTRAYALVTRSSQQGLSQAGPTLAQMDQYIPAEQRQKGIALAQQYERMAKQAAPLPARATVDPTAPAATYGVRTPAAAPSPAPTATASSDVTVRIANDRIPGPDGKPGKLTGKPSRVSPIPTSGRDVIAGPDGRPLPPPKSAPKPAPAAKPTPVAAATPASRPAAKPALRPAPKPAPAAAASGGKWRVQLGAFSNEANARTLWSRVGGRTGGTPAYVRAGTVVRLQATGFANRAEAQRACAKAGGGCLVVAP